MRATRYEGSLAQMRLLMCLRMGFREIPDKMMVRFWGPFATPADGGVSALRFRRR
jgi:hypothetical protein